jgi:hypothetical protein
MSPTLRNRSQVVGRTEPKLGHAEGCYFWACHLIHDDQPYLRQRAADYQQSLTGSAGIDRIPAQWLYLTMQASASPPR